MVLLTGRLSSLKMNVDEAEEQQGGGAASTLDQINILTAYILNSVFWDSGAHSFLSATSAHAVLPPQLFTTHSHQRPEEARPATPTSTCSDALQAPATGAPGSAIYTMLRLRPPGTPPTTDWRLSRQDLSHPQNLIRHVYTGGICFLRICPVWNHANRFKITLSRKQFISTELEAILIVLFLKYFKNVFLKNR